jgi:Icc protein
MPHRVLHLSDIHLTASGYDMDGVNAVESLERILFDCRHLENLDLVLVTGDIADDGSVEGCVLVRELVGAYASERGIAHIYSTGNHDRRDSFTAALGTGHRRSDGSDAGVPLYGVADERAAVSDVGGLRVVTLDSLVPGAVQGLISSAQLDALADLLAEPAPAGTILAFHHPPLHVPTRSDLKSVGLQNRDDLAAVVTGTDVIAILTGHFHVQLAGQFAGIPTWVTPGVVTRGDLTARKRLIRAVKGASATVVDVGGPYSPAFHVLHARQPGSNEQAYLIDAVTWQPIEEEG